MRITQADMDSRKRMAAFRSSLTDAVSQHEGITYGELLAVLAEFTAWWAYRLRTDELEEPDSDTEEKA